MMTRRLISTFGALAVVAVLALPMQAQMNAPVRVTVPFAFEAGEHAMPAGQYVIDRSALGSTILITAPSGDRRALLTFPTGDAANPKSPRLVFEKMGDTYRLAEVWVSGAPTGAGVPATKAQMLVAKNTKRERVEIALARR